MWADSEVRPHSKTKNMNELYVCVCVCELNDVCMCVSHLYVIPYVNCRVN